MAVAYRSHASTTGTDATAEGTIPAGTQVGDVMIAFLMHSASTATVSTGASGWDGSLEPDPNPADFSARFYFRVFQAGDANPTWTWSAAGNWTVDILSYSGADTGAPINAHIGEQIAAANSIVLGAITPNVNDCTLVGVGMTDATSAKTWTESDTPNERIDQGDNQQRRAVADWQLSGGSGIGVSRTFTMDGTSGDMAGFLLAIAPAVGAATPRPRGHRRPRIRALPRSRAIYAR